MTLVIAKKTQNHFSISSDTRISFQYGHTDLGIKVFSVPIRIMSPESSETGIKTIDYDYKAGLAFFGSSFNAYTVKEGIYEILQHLQHIPGYTDFSFQGIADLVFKVFNKLTLDLSVTLQSTGVCGLLLAGYCPEQNKVRIFEFNCDTSNYPIFPFHREILQDDGILFFGSGDKEAKSVFQNDNPPTPLHIIKKVISEGKIPSVGGGLQYGEIKDKDFEIFGVVDYNENTNIPFEGPIYTLRGVNLYKEDFEKGDDEFHIAYTFKNPFESEIHKIVDDLYRNNNIA